AMASTGGGSVITISSLTARIPGLGLAVYSGCRAGIDYAVRVAAHEYGPQGVRFNSIAAGLIKTDMTDALFESAETEQGHIQATPLRRMGSVDDIAQTALYLGDEVASGYVTGQLIDVAGGQNMGSLPNQEALEA
ncbi:MAG: SDR family oxidoreductase, partial [Alphaproteobacteria bacterium]|nr:SDR family oxidoreductase [Alphaproteobacteria bacterium]